MQFLTTLGFFCLIIFAVYWVLVNLCSIIAITRYILQQFHLYESDSPEKFPLKEIIFVCIEIVILIAQYVLLGNVSIDIFLKTLLLVVAIVMFLRTLWLILTHFNIIKAEQSYDNKFPWSELILSLCLIATYILLQYM